MWGIRAHWLEHLALPEAPGTIPPKAGLLCPVQEPKLAKNTGNRPFLVLASVVLSSRGDSLRRSRADGLK
jgi:hypothetical protein